MKKLIGPLLLISAALCLQSGCDDFEDLGDLFIKGVCGQAVGTGKIDKHDIIIAVLAIADPFFNCNPGEICDFLMCPGKSVENGGFAGIGITGQCYFYLPTLIHFLF